MLGHSGSFTVAHRLSSLARRLSCPSVCEILVPQLGIEPMSPAFQGGFLTTEPPGKSPLCILLTLSWASLVAQLVKNPPAMWETGVRSLGWENPLEKGIATHSSIPAGRIPWGCKESDTTF